MPDFRAERPLPPKADARTAAVHDLRRVDIEHAIIVRLAVLGERLMHRRVGLETGRLRARFHHAHTTGRENPAAKWRVEYFTSNGAQSWFLNPGAQGVGLVAGPTWSLNWAKKAPVCPRRRGGSAFDYCRRPRFCRDGSSGAERNQAIFLVEAGVLF